MNRKLKTLLLIAATAAPLSLWAANHVGAPGAMPAATTAAEMTDAEIRKVDKEAGKLTLKHAAIKNLDMPAMTMVFNVKDKAALDKLQAGDKVRFKAVNEAGKYTVVEIQPVR